MILRSLATAAPGLGLMVSQAMAMGGGRGGGGGGNGAPEIDGSAGLMALAMLVGAGLLAWNRYRR